MPYGLCEMYYLHLMRNVTTMIEAKQSFHYVEGVVSSTSNDLSKPLGNYCALMRQPPIKLKLF